MQKQDKSEIDMVMSDYFGDEQVTAIIQLKVDTKDADTIAERIAEHGSVEEVFLVTGDTDIVAKVKLSNYNQLKRFLIETISNIPGVKESKTLMAVTTFKEGGEIKYERAESEEKAESDGSG